METLALACMALFYILIFISFYEILRHLRFEKKPKSKQLTFEEAKAYVELIKTKR